ncbi:MAG TPA: glycosyl hydrolase [Trinickia sp.]|uniref:WD40/YVTN/BNR-like repeat-containing protein n=1 Tax=Trinickia sp. TaxID=2571163 RepID=UPI002D11C3BE|nr:glycosyl hydrolase [Trinickia sp.]HVW52925.1 glycosyl hydrolase [Trinickia sp.]
MTIRWETIATNFGRNDKPYGGGAFRVNGNEVISLKLVGPQLAFKPASELKDPETAEFTEAWMDDVSERLNRRTVAFLKGTLHGGLVRTFQERGQSSAWWYSKNWHVVYISTGWMDYKAPLPANGLAPQITKLWRSGDGGERWTQLNWPENRNIGQLLFLDPQRGYAIGWGPHVWRTTDAGQSWQEVELPPLANVGKPRRTFDAVNLGPDGVLRVAYYVGQLGEIKTSTLVYRLAWSESDFEQDVVLPNQMVVDLQSSPLTTGGYSLYALSKLGPPRDIDNVADNGRRTGALSTWGSVRHASVQHLQHTFDERLMFDGLSVGKDGVLLVYATDASGDGAPRDLTFLSKNFGKSWEELEDGAAQGGYFDPETNTQYALFAYTLKKRRF